MNRLVFAREYAAQIREIVGTIYGLTNILEDDACRDSADGEEAVLGRFEKGVINTAIRRLANDAEELAEAIEDLHIPGASDGGES